MTDEQAIIKLGLKTGAGSLRGKSVQATIRFVIQPVIFSPGYILHSVYDSRSTRDICTQTSVLLCGYMRSQAGKHRRSRGLR